MDGEVEEKDNKEGGHRVVGTANQFRQTAVYSTSSITAVIWSHRRELPNHKLIYWHNTHTHIRHTLTSIPAVTLHLLEVQSNVECGGHKNDRTCDETIVGVSL